MHAGMDECPSLLRHDVYQWSSVDKFASLSSVQYREILDGKEGLWLAEKEVVENILVYRQEDLCQK